MDTKNFIIAMKTGGNKELISVFPDGYRGPTPLSTLYPHFVPTLPGGNRDMPLQRLQHDAGASKFVPTLERRNEETGKCCLL